MYGYVYKTTNLLNGKIYIGQHRVFNDRLDENYYGSGRLILNAIEKYGKENFICEVLCWCNTQESLDKEEINNIKLFNSNSRSVGYNLSSGGRGCLDVENQRVAASNYMHNRTVSEETRDRMSTSAKTRVKKHSMTSQKDVPWISNGIEERKLMPGEEIPDGFVLHKRISNNYTSFGCKDKYKNGFYVNRDGKTRYVHKDELDSYLADGYCIGRAKEEITPERCTNISKAKKGAVCITDGTKNKFVKKEEVDYYIGIGYVLGSYQKLNKRK